MPALLIRMSRRVDLALKVWAADLIESKEVRSRDRKVTFACGYSFFRDSMAAWAFDSVLAARKISRALCAARWRIVSRPRPVLPGGTIRIMILKKDDEMCYRQLSRSLFQTDLVCHFLG